MTMPPLADVKAAAEGIVNGPSQDWRTTPEIVLMEEAVEHVQVLAQFALAVLNSPGMSAERLAEIAELESKATARPWVVSDHIADPYAGYGSKITEGIVGAGDNIVLRFDPSMGEYGAGLGDPEGDGAFIADARQAVPELLAEVLRLRALAVPQSVTLADGIRIEAGPDCRIIPDDDPRMVAWRAGRTP